MASRRLGLQLRGVLDARVTRLPRPPRKQGLAVDFTYQESYDVLILVTTTCSYLWALLRFLVGALARD